MKNLKTFSFFLFFILISLATNAQEKGVITLEDSKSLDGASEVVCNLNGTVQTESWDQDYIKVVTEIKTNDLTKEIIKHLADKNRFKIASTIIGENAVELLNPNILLPVYINGRRLKEDVSYKIYIPFNTTVRIQSDDESPAVAEAVNEYSKTVAAFPSGE